MRREIHNRGRCLLAIAPGDEDCRGDTGRPGPQGRWGGGWGGRTDVMVRGTETPGLF